MLAFPDLFGQLTCVIKNHGRDIVLNDRNKRGGKLEV